MAVRILLVDDNAKMRLAYRALIAKAAELSVVGEVEDGDQTLEAVLRLNPDLVLMDVEMKRVGGLAATRLLSQLHPATPKVMMVSGHGDDHLVAEALRAGACGYLLKTRAALELVVAIRKVMAGGVFITERMGVDEGLSGFERVGVAAVE
jgi:DNA-binding NarL/FixJ family response regulator